ncbi:MAG: magnesium transporter [Chlamydiales bacterium]|nr:magnesium transporter [Chlamydiales bacterium]
MTLRNLHKQVKDHVKQVNSLVYDDQTIQVAIDQLREKGIKDKIAYFYVIDRENHLVGVISVRDLLLNPGGLAVKEVMDKKVITLKEDQSLAEAMALLETKHLLALPVLDANDKFIGIIDIGHYLEESVDIANTKQRMQIFQMLGFYIDEEKKVSVWRSYGIRMPWIFCNIFSGVACAVISRFYEVVLGQMLILAMFIPLVLALSESISMQSMAQHLNLPSHKRLLEHPLKMIFKHWKLYCLLGVTCGVIVGSVSILWGDGLGPAIIICLGIISSVIITAFIGAMVPIFLQSKRLDPKVASGPVVLMSADIVTTLIYLSLASYFLL